MIKNKKEWYKLFNNDVCFNRPAAYSLEEFLKVHKKYDFQKIFCFRNAAVTGAPFVCMPKWEALFRIKEKTFQKPYFICEQMPDEHIMVQGEYDGLCANISFKQTPMRFALQQERIEISRLQLLDLVGYTKYNMLNEFIEKYNPENDLKHRAVIEFSFYDCPVGVFEKDYIIWEIRNY
jgi:hypothetical protein